MKIFGSEYEFLTGVLGNSKKVEGIQRNPSGNWKTIEVENKIPLINNSLTPNTSFNDQPLGNRIIKFGMCSEGQNFLPYFDGQDIMFASSPSAISGLELFYYYTDGFGGFISPRISSINFNEAMKEFIVNV